VVVMLDGVESRLHFVSIDIELAGVCGVHELVKESSVDAFLVVYSISDKPSFLTAAETLKCLRTGNEILGANRTRPCILVGNKSDLVRKRAVSATEARTLAFKYASKFVETSVAINDKVDDLLAGTLKQIRLREAQDRAAEAAHAKLGLMKKMHSRNFSDAHLNELIKNSAANSDAAPPKSGTLTRKLFSRLNGRKENGGEEQKNRVYVNAKITDELGAESAAVASTTSANGNYTFFHKLFNTLFKKRALQSNLHSVENLFTLPITFTNKVKKVA
jgi:hypothetical protein